MTTTLILATYNGKKYLKEQLDSLRQQTIPFDEVLIHDDCSTDGTIEFVNEYIKEFQLHNWFFQKNEKNLGYETNFFHLLREAKNDLVFLCDQDDIWALDKVEKCLDFFKKRPDANLLCTDNDFLDINNPTRKIQEIRNMCFDDSVEKACHNKEGLHIGRPGCDMVTKRDFISLIERYWVNGFAQDEFLWKFSYLFDSTYLYHFKGITRRIHGDNTASTEGKTKYRNIQGRVSHLTMEKKALQQVLTAYEDFAIVNDAKKKKLLRHIKALEYRIKMLSKRNVFLWMKMFFYLDTYSRKKGYCLDLLIILKGK